MGKISSNQTFRHTCAISLLLFLLIYGAWRFTIINEKYIVSSYLFFLTSITTAISSVFIIVTTWNYTLPIPLKYFISSKKIDVLIPTYKEPKYESLPMFAENRIHQRSSGNPYPNPVINQVKHDQLIDKEYEVINIENQYIHLMILPAIGGRIFAAMDKTNHYDFFYHQHVIKPALIGMLGLWISGGVEFNWPIHHRPSTYMPVDYEIEEGKDGSITVWLSEHEPMDRMKGMVGICLYPDRAIIETKMKLYNRTMLPKSFLWWENAAVPVNPDYSIFFPQDVTYANFHYKKAVGSYPVMNEYFNVQDNRGGNDIRFHNNTAQAVSYFSGISRFDFFGGYDHGKHAGVIHAASHHTSVGHKMFTWGYNQLSRVWENALTDDDGPYAELMASSFSDNQPDFTWIEPLEIKECKQVWYPYKGIGEPQNANERLALRYEIHEGKISIHLYATENFDNASVTMKRSSKILDEKNVSLMATIPAVISLDLPNDFDEKCFEIIVSDGKSSILSYSPVMQKEYVPDPREDNPQPDNLKTADDCFMVGMHVMQYRDPYMKPNAYWEQGLTIDPNHSGCLKGLGIYYLERYQYDLAEFYLNKALKSITRWNLNPRDTEVYYLSGLVLKIKGKTDDAYEAFHKAIWNKSGMLPSYYCIALIDCIRGEFHTAEKHLRELLHFCGRNQKALCLLSTVLYELGKTDEALKIADEIVQEDPLDYFALNARRLITGAEFIDK